MNIDNIFMTWVRVNRIMSVQFLIIKGFNRNNTENILIMEPFKINLVKKWIIWNRGVMFKNFVFDEYKNVFVMLKLRGMVD